MKLTSRALLTLLPVAVTATALFVPLTSATAQVQPLDVVVNDNPEDWTPKVLDGRVNSLADDGTTMFAGGTFTQIQGVNDPNVSNQSYLFAFDSSTGDIDKNFSPSVNGEIETVALSSDGRTLYIGGSFTKVDNQNRDNFAAVDTQTGGVDKLSADANAIVQEIVVQNDEIYVSGRFTQFDGQSRSGMARLDPQTGHVDSSFDVPFTNPPAGTLAVPEFDITPDGSRLVAVGNFGEVGGQPRVQVAMLDLTTNPVSVANWETDEYPVFWPNGTSFWCQSNFLFYMRDVDFSPDGSYFVIGTTGANRPNKLCDTVTRWETDATGTGVKPTWVQWTGGDTVTSVAAAGSAIYIGGHNQWINDPYVDQDCGVCANPYPGAVYREGLAALDPLNGLPYTWDPGRSRGEGVSKFLTTDAGLWVGSDTDRLGDEIHPKLGFFSTNGGTAIPPSDPYTLPGDLYNMRADTGALQRRSFDGSNFGTTQDLATGVNWLKARGVLALNGRLYMGWAKGKMFTRTFDGTTVGPAQKINLHGLGTAPEPHTFFIPGTTIPVPAFTDQLKTMTGLFFDNGRFYYTVKGDPRLYYRYFTPQSQIVGASLFVASTEADGVPWSQVRGMTLASGKLTYATSSGDLNQVDFDGAPTGSPQVIGGPGVDGTNWASKGMFVFN